MLRNEIRVRPLLISLAWLSLAACHGASPRAHGQESPYADQLDSPIRGLSAQEVEDLREGRGMGLARAAELNHYPGPRHVLELRSDLAVDAATVASLEEVVRGMQAEAKLLGAEILQAESALSDAFRAGAITPDELTAQTEALGELYARLRATHLRAHIETKALLSPQQVAKYDELRGYGAGHGHHHGR